MFKPVDPHRLSLATFAAVLSLFCACGKVEVSPDGGAGGAGGKGGAGGSNGRGGTGGTVAGAAGSAGGASGGGGSNAGAGGLAGTGGVTGTGGGAGGAAGRAGAIAGTSGGAGAAGSGGTAGAAGTGGSAGSAGAAGTGGTAGAAGTGGTAGAAGTGGTAGAAGTGGTAGAAGTGGTAGAAGTGGTAGAAGTGGTAGAAGGGGSLPAPPTEFVVVRVGDGASLLSSTAVPVFLERRSIATGAVSATLPLPTAASATDQAFTLAGSAVAEGALSLSTDGRTLTLLGYQSPPGTATVQTTTPPRVVAAVDAADFAAPAGVDTSTTIGTSFSGNSPRAAIASGSNVWVGGSGGGIFVTTLGSTASPTNIQTSPGNNRVLGIFQGQLYASTGSSPGSVYQIGVGEPITSGTTTTPVVGTASPYGFSFLDLLSNEPGVDTLYLADDGAGQGIQRYVKSGGAWGATPVAILGPSVRHLACFQDGSDVVCLAASGNTLYRLRDVGATSSSSQTALVAIGTAPTNTGFRGVALAPSP